MLILHLEEGKLQERKAEARRSKQLKFSAYMIILGYVLGAGIEPWKRGGNKSSF